MISGAEYIWNSQNFSRLATEIRPCSIANSALDEAEVRLTNDADIWAVIYAFSPLGSLS